MFNFFKRSKSKLTGDSRQKSQNACVDDLLRHTAHQQQQQQQQQQHLQNTDGRKNNRNQDESSDGLPENTRNNQNDNDLVGECTLISATTIIDSKNSKNNSASGSGSSGNSFFDIMAKGRNRRNNNNNNNNNNNKKKQDYQQKSQQLQPQSKQTSPPQQPSQEKNYAGVENSIESSKNSATLESKRDENEEKNNENEKSGKILKEFQQQKQQLIEKNLSEKEILNSGGTRRQGENNNELELTTTTTLPTSTMAMMISPPSAIEQKKKEVNAVVIDKNSSDVVGFKAVAQNDLSHSKINLNSVSDLYEERQEEHSGAENSEAGSKNQHQLTNSSSNSSTNSSNSDGDVPDAADFVRQLVLNKYKKSQPSSQSIIYIHQPIQLSAIQKPSTIHNRQQPIGGPVQQQSIGKSKSSPGVNEEMGQPQSKQNKGISGSASSPTIIDDDKEVFYEANDEIEEATNNSDSGISESLSKSSSLNNKPTSSSDIIPSIVHRQDCNESVNDEISVNDENSVIAARLCVEVQPTVTNGGSATLELDKLPGDGDLGIDSSSQLLPSKISSISSSYIIEDACSRNKLSTAVKVDNLENGPKNAINSELFVNNNHENFYIKPNDAFNLSEFVITPYTNSNNNNNSNSGVNYQSATTKQPSIYPKVTSSSLSSLATTTPNDDELFNTAAITTTSPIPIITKNIKNDEFSHLRKSSHLVLEDTVSLPDVVESITILPPPPSPPTTINMAPPAVLSELSSIIPATIDDISVPHMKIIDEDKVIINEEVINGKIHSADKRDLVNQEAKYTAQLEVAEKQAFSAQSKANDLQNKLAELEREISIKTWAAERLQAELLSAHKEGECVRKKLRLQETEMDQLRNGFSDKEEEMMKRYNELESLYTETKQKLEELQKFTNSLQVQLAEAQVSAESARLEKDKLINERSEEQKIVQDTLDTALTERAQMDAKWRHEFEQLRNLNQDREEHLMEDCEWKMRSMQKTVKEKLELAENAKQEALAKAAKIEEESKRQAEEVKSLRTSEAELAQLRGLTADQCESLANVSQQLEEIKLELYAANKKAEKEIENAQRIRRQCLQDMSDKDRQLNLKIEETKMQIAMQWERKLIEEMVRLKCELESIHGDDRKEALDKLKAEYAVEVAELIRKHNSIVELLRQEIVSLKETLSEKVKDLIEAQEKADKQMVNTRIYVERSDRENQLLLDKEIRYREELVEQLEKERDREREEMEEQFRERLQSVKDEFARELSDATQEMEAKHKKFIELQYEQLIAEKEEALQAAESKYRMKVKDMEGKIKEIEITHQRSIEDLQRNHSIERTTLEQRDLQNAQEIDTLHRKCRCLTKLFEEMRMRYERRDPRPEDLREIAELKDRVELQERDLHRLTEQLRDLQLSQQPQGGAPPRTKGGKNARKNRDNELKVKLNCDVIYEEQESELENGDDTHQQQQKEDQKDENNQEISVNNHETIGQNIELEINGRGAGEPVIVQ